MVYYNPYIITGYNPLYNPTNQGIFHGSCGLSLFLWNADVTIQMGLAECIGTVDDSENEANLFVPIL